MYGTVARMKIKPGGLEELAQMENGRKPKGIIGTLVYRSDDKPDELWMVVLFEDKASYHANAESPVQDQEFQRLRALLQEDPEWHDGEVVFNSLPGLGKST